MSTSPSTATVTSAATVHLTVPRSGTRVLKLDAQAGQHHRVERDEGDARPVSGRKMRAVQDPLADDAPADPVIVRRVGEDLLVPVDVGQTWVEADRVTSSPYGELRVWNGSDLNGQAYQVLVATAVTTSVL
ncbi:hypothetical protein [Sphaerotilus mobilis]|uniref:Uncharacterized protein n=1 Tax=Sphaerotilus mobilis TaxID=47994 RepID=A0A4Q7LSE1_9BURK|nr:hypothetical protein [Sphaerotilus mobilis]RZS57217.1 hypothetical protein EV685_1785 [Sphaerotilus mobilis]